MLPTSRYSAVIPFKYLSVFLSIRDETTLTKRKTSVSLDTELLAWIEKKIKEKKFASVSHAVEYALEELRRTES